MSSNQKAAPEDVLYLNIYNLKKIQDFPGISFRTMGMTSDLLRLLAMEKKRKIRYTNGRHNWFPSACSNKIMCCIERTRFELSEEKRLSPEARWKFGLQVVALRWFDWSTSSCLGGFRIFASNGHATSPSPDIISDHFLQQWPELPLQILWSRKFSLSL